MLSFPAQRQPVPATGTREVLVPSILFCDPGCVGNYQIEIVCHSAKTVGSVSTEGKGFFLQYQNTCPKFRGGLYYSMFLRGCACILTIDKKVIN